MPSRAYLLSTLDNLIQCKHSGGKVVKWRRNCVRDPTSSDSDLPSAMAETTHDVCGAHDSHLSTTASRLSFETKPSRDLCTL